MKVAEKCTGELTDDLAEYAGKCPAWSKMWVFTFLLILFVVHSGWAAQYNKSLLPEECDSPSGDSCDWYQNCLEKKYPCEASSYPYAITYAEKYCRLFLERRNKFSADAQKWMDGVRKCLQVALVPLLRTDNKPTCKEIREIAFASHTPCYLRPGKDLPSICDLSNWQRWKIFWTIKRSFIQRGTKLESLKGLWNIGTTCLRSKDEEKYKEVMKIFKLKIKKFTQRKRRSTDSLPEADVQSRFADRVGSALASAMKWNTDVMDWFAYNDNLDIVIVLADIKALGVVNTSIPSVNFNQTIQEFASAVEKGSLPVQVDGNKVWITSLALCSDKSCDNAQTLASHATMLPTTQTPAFSEKPSQNCATGIFQCTLGLCGVIAVFVMLMDKLLF
ncbi:uncharacterized protein LOC144642693 isoform X1 [Oculina patagonica]